MPDAWERGHIVMLVAMPDDSRDWDRQGQWCVVHGGRRRWYHRLGGDRLLRRDRGLGVVVTVGGGRLHHVCLLLLMLLLLVRLVEGSLGHVVRVTGSDGRSVATDGVGKSITGYPAS